MLNCVRIYGSRRFGKRRAASAIMAVFPETGFRVGGDEFVIAKAEISEEQFLRKMDQLHEEMESRQIILCMKQRENII